MQAVEVCRKARFESVDQFDQVDPEEIRGLSGLHTKLQAAIRALPGFAEKNQAKWRKLRHVDRDAGAQPVVPSVANQVTVLSSVPGARAEPLRGVVANDEKIPNEVVKEK